MDRTDIGPRNEVSTTREPRNSGEKQKAVTAELARYSQKKHKSFNNTNTPGKQAQKKHETQVTCNVNGVYWRKDQEQIEILQKDVSEQSKANKELSKANQELRKMVLDNDKKMGTMEMKLSLREREVKTLRASNDGYQTILKVPDYEKGQKEEDSRLWHLNRDVSQLRKTNSSLDFKLKESATQNLEFIKELKYLRPRSDIVDKLEAELEYLRPKSDLVDKVNEDIVRSKTEHQEGINKVTRVLEAEVFRWKTKSQEDIKKIKDLEKAIAVKAVTLKWAKLNAERANEEKKTSLAFAQKINDLKDARIKKLEERLAAKN